jgi:tagaturonate reductase
MLEHNKAENTADVERIIQFGEGNFLRAFVDWMVQEMNEKAKFNTNVVVVQPIKNGMIEKLNNQDCSYHVVLKGLKNGKAMKEVKHNSSISRGINPYVEYENYLKLAEKPSMRFIISNTTEAGIAFNESDTFEMRPPSSFPAKLTHLLYHRFEHFKGDSNKGFIILPCELIENNAVELKKCVLQYCKLWNLSAAFVEWIEKSNTFCNTLVDRIVPGFNEETAKELAEKMSIEDRLCVDAEQFHLWVIEGDKSIRNEFPTDKAELNVLYVNDVKPYRNRKVRLLNGTHTLMTPVAFLAGIEFVRNAVENEVVGKYITNTIDNEIIPILDLPLEESRKFANEVLDRFRNPFVNHALSSIALNSISKFKARLLPTLLDYKSKFNKLPDNIVFSFAALMLFYKGEYNGIKIPVQDDAKIMDFFKSNWASYTGEKQQLDIIVKNTLKNTQFWGMDLSEVKDLETKTAYYLDQILSKGMVKAVEELISK